MKVTLYALVMGFGALVAGIGLVLLFRKHEQQALSRIKIVGQEFQFSAPGLVVLLAGCVLFVLLPVLGVGDRDLFPGKPDDGINHGVMTPGHHSFETAYLVKFGSSTKGAITTPTDPDFFKFQVPTTLNGVPKIRIIVETTFYAKATVYDNDEQSVNSGDSFSGPVSLSFDGTPGAYYYIAFESKGDRGEYTLIVRQE